MTLALLVVASPAAARGSVRVAKATLEESDSGTWKLKFTLNWGSVPDRNYIPMTFSFKQTGIYERFLNDAGGKKAQTRTVPVRNATPVNVPMDVGFSDVSGKAFKITKFGMKLRRDADFEAGEYRLTVKVASGGNLGTPMTIRLRGKNKVIDRRSMVFGGEVKGPNKSNAKPPVKEKQPGDDNAEPKAAEDYGLDLSGIADDPDDVDDADGPPSEKPKQGGCGCQLPGTRGGPEGLGLLSILALAGGLLLRRRD
jgi:hypothetical protein